MPHRELERGSLRGLNLMKKISFILSFLFISSLSFAQTAEEVIAKYITAIGGKDAITAIKDITMNMTGEVQGTALEVIVQKKSPNKSLTSATVAGMGEVQRAVCDGTKARTSGMQGTTDLSGKALEAMIAQSKLFPELSYAESGVKLAISGTEKINGKDAHKIVATLGESKWTEFYEVASGLKLRMIAESEMGTITMDYDDYKAVSGVKFYHKLNQDTGQFQIEMTAKSVEVNKDLADALFEIK
jgi:hypothetical protein